MKQQKLLCIILSAYALLTGCSDTDQSSSETPSELVVSTTSVAETTEIQPFPVEVCGVEFETSAKEVISLSPAVTEIIMELGYADRLRGISSYCNYPEFSLQTVGSSENPDIDVITGMSPDVVFTLSGMSERDIYAIQAEGTAVVCLTPPTIVEEYGKLYADIESVFSGAAQGAAAGDEAVNALTKASEMTTLGSFVYITDKLTAAGAGTIENAVLSLSGANVCTEEGYTELLSLEGSAPKYIIASDSLTYEDISADDTLAAMISGGAEVLYVTATVFERPTAMISRVFNQMSEQLSDTSEA